MQDHQSFCAATDHTSCSRMKQQLPMAGTLAGLQEATLVQVAVTLLEALVQLSGFPLPALHSTNAVIEELWNAL